MAGQCIDVAPGFDFSRPADKERNARPALIYTGFSALHTGVIHRTNNRTVIGHENKDRIFSQIPLLQLLHQPPHVVIHIADHREETGLPFGLRIILGVCNHLGVLFRHAPRGMGCVREDAGEERFAGIVFLLHPLYRPPEEHVGAKIRVCTNCPLWRISMSLYDPLLRIPLAPAIPPP